VSLAYRIVVPAIRRLVRILCRIHDEELERVPQEGPLLIVTNHINFLEAPVFYTHLIPRPLTGLAKIENWSNPFFAPLMKLVGAIPVRRGEGDVSAIRASLEALEAGKMMAITPEGTRSGHGRLQKARAGAVVLALRSEVPLLPVAHYGGERFWRNVSRLRRTDFHIVVGNQFRIVTDGQRVSGEVRQQIVDEIMYQVAALLPPAYRGYYSDLDAATERYIRFAPGVPSNLERARS
jgi:1-acyl-sn-glycerol-3-phosphate acyltransferase